MRAEGQQCVVVCVCDVDSGVSLSSTARRASIDVNSTLVIGGSSTFAISGREIGCDKGCREK